MKRTVAVILDRIEEDVAVLIDDAGKVYECPALLLRGILRENSAFTAEFDGDVVTALSPREIASAGKNAERLRRLLDK